MSVLLLFSSIASLTFDDENKNCCCLNPQPSGSVWGTARGISPQCSVTCQLRRAPCPAVTGDPQNRSDSQPGYTYTPPVPSPAITHIAEAPAVLFLSPSQFQDFLCSDRGARNPSSGAC